MPQEQLGTMYPFAMLALVFVFFYFFAIRPQKKREKEVTAMRNALKVGDRVTTIGGIRGKVSKVGEEYVTIEVGNAKTKLEVTKWAIGNVDQPGSAPVVTESTAESVEEAKEE